MSAIAEPPTQQPAGAGSLNFAKVLQQMLAVSDKVSDLIFSPGRPPQIELVGKLQPVAVPGLEKLTPAHTFGIAKIMIGASAGLIFRYVGGDGRLIGKSAAAALIAA